jgi:hypothetical protein
MSWLELIELSDDPQSKIENPKSKISGDSPQRAGKGGQSHSLTQDPSHSFRTSFGFAILDFGLKGKKRMNEKCWRQILNSCRR